MGTLNIEWINANKGSSVSMEGKESYVDVLPVNFTDASFQSMTTSAVSADSDVAPTDTTHALVTSVSAVHYVRKTTAPATGTGGICVMAGASRLIPIEAGVALKVVTSA